MRKDRNRTLEERFSVILEVMVSLFVDSLGVRAKSEAGEIVNRYKHRYDLMLLVRLSRCHDLNDSSRIY